MTRNTLFSPTDALRAIRAVNSDQEVSPAEARALVAVILRADNKTALAWAGYRSITRETGISSATIRQALRHAEGRYFARHGKGVKGATLYRLAIQSVKRIGDASALPSEAERFTHKSASALASKDILTPVTNPSTNPKGARRKNAAAPVAFPSVLDTSVFREAWQRWLGYRKELGRRFTSTTQGAQLQMLAKHGPAAAVAMIDQSIEKGWQGLFEPKLAQAAKGSTFTPAKASGNFAGLVKTFGEKK